MPDDVQHGAPLPRRIAAYVAALVGYLLYCYNFNVVDYVRPNLISAYGFTLGQTADLTIAQNIGVTVGAFLWAGLIARIGHRIGIGIVAAAIGGVAVLLALASSFPLWFGLRGLLSAALGGYYVVATGLVVALFSAHVRGRLITLNSAMYPLSNIVMGLAGAALGDARWHLLLWIGAIPLLIAPLAVLLVPRDRGGRPEPEADAAPEHAPGGWREMFSTRWRWVTIGCALLSGIDFVAYQFFAALVTLYLRQRLGYGAVQVGATVALLSGGSLVGSFAWGWVADRFGRRTAAAGYLLAAAAILLFLFGGLTGRALDAAALAFGLGLSCTSAWGAWFAELFPRRLRSHGASLFHAGHIFAMAGPLFIGAFGEQLGLVRLMAIGALVYVGGAALWLSLPETLGRETASEH